ncbi:MAG: Cupin domain-containing protein [Candidatus Kentron sp. G]|nr:MAG: Cupin domain-containing protein [Candidatus Kentron sp. G]
MTNSTAPYVRVYVDDDGESHFQDMEVTLNSVDYAPPASPLDVSDAIDAHRFVFVGGAPGWVGDWHPSPKRQFVFVLSGVVEVTVSDGETRRFEPGSTVLLEDVTGRGHLSRLSSKEFTLTAMVHVES